MAGHVFHHPPIAVDYWKLRESSHVRLFFLTHMHSDHTVGLTPSWTQKIYCSPITKKLLLDKFSFSPQQVIELNLNETCCLVFGNDCEETLSVTLIEANHCPGAVMFLFEGYFGRILYTGDFRFSQSLIFEDSFQHLGSAVIDELWLDNTFCSPKCEFPSREKAMAEVLRIISEHTEHRVMIGLRKLGKESLLVAIAKLLKLRIYCSEERYHAMELLHMPNVFTTVETEARIHVVNQSDINSRNMDSWNKEMPTIGIIPTAVYHVLEMNNGLKNCSNIFIVPYSDHSSFSELCEFVSLVSPRAVFPILKDAKSRLYKSIPEHSDMSCFKDFLDNSPRPAFCAPVVFTTKQTADKQSEHGKPSGFAKKPYRFRKVTKGVIYNDGSDNEQKSTTSRGGPEDLDSLTVDKQQEKFCDMAAVNEVILSAEDFNESELECFHRREKEELATLHAVQPSDAGATGLCFPTEAKDKRALNQNNVFSSDCVMSILEPIFVEEAQNMFSRYIINNKEKK